MLVISTLGEAIGLMVVGIFLLGTWPAVWNLIEQRGRIPSHIFLDYSLTYLVVACVVSLTLGQLGPTDSMPAFTDQLHQANGKMVAFALAGGACLALGDLAMQYSTAFLGLSIGPPVLNSLTVIIGVILSYFLDGGINKPQLVFPGMACAAIAIALGAAAHVVSQRRQRQCSVYRGQDNGCTNTDPSSSGSSLVDSVAVCVTDVADSGGISSKQEQQQMQHLAITSVDDCAARQKKGTAVLQQQPQHEQQQQRQQQEQCILSHSGKDITRQRSIKMGGSSVFLGLAIAIIGGSIYSLFLPAYQIAANDPFGLLPPEVLPLSVYTTYFYFAVGFTSVSVLLNAVFLYKAPFGTSSSSLKSYLSDNRGRALSILSGLLAALGDLTQFIGGQVAGYAAAMLVMAYPVVGVLWGMASFKEFRQGTRTSLMLVIGQIACYIAAVALLAGSAELRP